MIQEDNLQPPGTAILEQFGLHGPGSSLNNRIGWMVRIDHP